MIAKETIKLSTRCILSAFVAIGSLAPSTPFAADGSQAQAQASGATPNDYFHTGAGARYLVRAKSPIDVEPQRGDITVLMGSGGNITVLSGKDGKFLVDAGISPSKEKLQIVLDDIGPTPLKYLVNTHWHWDHTDGNAWMHEAGATIIAHRNTARRLTVVTHVNDWNWTFQPVENDARPTILVDTEKTFNFDDTRIQIEHFGPGHTDGDLWVYFEKADVLSLGDTFWNGYFPYIDNEDGGNINSAIQWADKAIERTTDHTIVVPGHGPVGTRADLIDFRNMLVTVRDNVRTLKEQGRSLDEIIAAKPAIAFEDKWGHFVINGDHFVRLVYAGL